MENNSRKLKIVWLCHFANQEMKDYFGKQNVSNFAPWINELISIFKTKGEVELHIVAPNVYINVDVVILKDNINYHFYKTKNFKNAFTRILTNGYLTNFIFIKWKIKKIINQIQPDLIHLHGAENPYYSAGIIPLLNKYPTLITIQGFAHKEMTKNFFHTIRCRVEKSILKRAKYFGYRADFLPGYLKKFNSKAKFIYHLYPINSSIKLVNPDLDHKKKYDIIFYGRVSKDKGIEDLFQAAKIIIRQNPNIKILVIGNPSEKYKKYLNALITTLSIQNNIIFKPYVSTQLELFDAIMDAKICLLPTYADIIPFTISEAMFLKVPVISYNIEGVNDYNKTGQYISLVDKGDIKGLSTEISNLLANNSKREIQANRAYNFIITKFDEEEIFTNIFSAYKLILQTSK